MFEVRYYFVTGGTFSRLAQPTPSHPLSNRVLVSNVEVLTQNQVVGKVLSMTPLG